MSSFNNFHPFMRPKEYLPAIVADVPMPALDDASDPFSTTLEEPTAADISGFGEMDMEQISEYHHSNMKFWGYMIIAFIVMVLATVAVWTGATRPWYQSLEEPFATNSNVVVIGNVFFLAFITFIAYHLHKDHYSRGIRQGSIFFLGMGYILLLAWAATLYGSELPRNAALWLTFLCAFMAIALWIIWDMPAFKDKKWLLYLAALWLLYLLYYTVGLIVLNENRVECEELKSKYRHGM